ncbi:MAG: TolB family protein [Rhodanobacteraceae bacterium]
MGGQTLFAFAAMALATAVFSGTVQEWKPEGISSPMYESHAAFDPLTGNFWFVRSTPQFSGWHLLVSHCTKDGWSAPEPPPFAGKGLEADPWFTPDGAHLYFISTRATGSGHGKDLDIWRVDRDGREKWGTPQRLPEPVNSDQAEWFPRLAADGWLYFGSMRPAGMGGNDIWRARQDVSGKWHVDNAGPALNTSSNEYEALPSPDGKRMIVAADDGLYESRFTATGWSSRVKLEPEVDANGSELGAAFSPSGRSMLFARDTRGPDSGEFFLWREAGEENWPPQCPKQGELP